MISYDCFLCFTDFRNLIELHCQDNLEDGDPEEEENNEELVRKYDEELSEETSADANKSSDVTSFCSGILVALGVVVVSSFFKIGNDILIEINVSLDVIIQIR